MKRPLEKHLFFQQNCSYSENVVPQYTSESQCFAGTPSASLGSSIMETRGGSAPLVVRNWFIKPCSAPPTLEMAGQAQSGIEERLEMGARARIGAAVVLGIAARIRPERQPGPRRHTKNATICSSVVGVSFPAFHVYWARKTIAATACDTFSGRGTFLETQKRVERIGPRPPHLLVI